MTNRFAISISGKVRPGAAGQLPSSGSPGTLKSLLYGFAAIVLVSAALVVGMALGTAVAFIIGVLVAGALAVLLIQGALNRFRPLRDRATTDKDERL